MSGYVDPLAVWTPPNSNVKIDPNDPAFSLEDPDLITDASLPAIYLFSNSRNGDGIAYSMAEDGTVLGSHWCSHWGYMRHDLHNRPDRKKTCEEHYPDGYRLVVLTEPGSTPPPEVVERNRIQGEEAEKESVIAEEKEVIDSDRCDFCGKWTDDCECVL